ncbi:hypothetical protein [Lacticaseibacillus brantae]|uniref:hypothetical protein n=1 Tax=Lacticaseibacillus brantae TaxID=943673 RepID=UPI000A6C9D02|nr:hypothetical protein [Lacticaseibacillus brantae]
MWKVYFFAVLALVLVGFAIASFVGHNYWQAAGELVVGLLGAFVAFGTYHDQKASANKR